MINQSAGHVLVLYAQYIDRLNYYDDWLDAFRDSEYFRVSQRLAIRPKQKKLRPCHI